MGACSRRTTGVWIRVTTARSRRARSALTGAAPPEGSRHLITLAELRRFSELLPDWDEVAVGLDAIVLDSATDLRRLVRTRRRGICAWDHDPWDWWSADMEHEHRHILDLLAVERVPITE